MGLDLNNVDHIVFDLGGVILNIDYGLTEQAFMDLGATDIQAVYTRAQQTSLFDNYEKGIISDQEFKQGLREITGLNTSDEELEAAWNAMLLDMPPARLDLLAELSRSRDLYLLSNTNEIHIRAFQHIVANAGLTERFEAPFTNMYYSSRVGMRKPDTEIFDFVCVSNELVHTRTLFIDDSEQHVEGARKAGLQAHLLAPGQDILDLF